MWAPSNRSPQQKRRRVDLEFAAQQTNLMTLIKGHKFRLSLQINRLRLIEGRGFIYAHASPEQEFDFVFDE
jgi:hypothetical protein